MTQFKKDIFLFLILGAILLSLTTFVNLKNNKTHTVSWNTMGTIATISGKNYEIVNEASLEAKNLFSEYNKLLSSWDSNSELSQISQNAGNGKTLNVSTLVTNVYQIAFKGMRQSSGAFNPLIGNVMKLWGFNGARKIDKSPNKSKIASLPFSPNDVYFENPKIRLEKNGMSLDLGGVAKGEAIDQLASKLISRFPNEELLINLGGNIKTLGNTPKKIGIRNPFGEGYVATILLTNLESVATSGDYERFVEIDGKKYSHIFDGRTGEPATNNIASTTVIAKSAAIADMLSTTLYVLGTTEGMKFINDFYPDVAVLWISTSNVWTTSPRMKERILFRATNP
jgi:thiamine biosynthesis lipoprotein